MQIDSEYHWLLINLARLSEVIFIAATIILSIRLKKIEIILVMVGFVGLAVGEYIMLEASRGFVELKQTGGNLAAAKNYYLLGRSLSSNGMLLSSVSLFYFAIKQKK